MDWTQIIMMILGGTTVGGTISALVYRKQNKRLKNNEVKTSDVATQKAQMDLGEEYLKKVMELSEMNYQQSLKNGKDNAEIIEEVMKVKENVNSIVSYLNGDYQKYLSRKAKDTEHNLVDA